jgi:hypothetical protein
VAVEVRAAACLAKTSFVGARRSPVVTVTTWSAGAMGLPAGSRNVI